MTAYRNADTGEVVSDIAFVAQKLGLSVGEAQAYARGERPMGLIATATVPSIAPWVEVIDPDADLNAARKAKAEAVEAVFDAKLSAGLAYAGEVVALDDRSQTRFTAMGATALGVIGGALPTWPPEYSAGWIAVSNNRIPLDTAADGLKLASAAGAYTGALIQYARDLKSAALASSDPHTIDETAGWPANT